MHCLLGFGTAIVYFIQKYYSAAITFLIFAVIYTFFFFSWRKRIPFSTQMLQFTMDVMKKYPSTIVVSFLGLITSVIFGAWWSVSLVSAYVKYHPNGAGQSNPACTTTGGDCSSAALILVLIFFGISHWYPSDNSVCGILYFGNDQEYHPCHHHRNLWIFLRIYLSYHG